MPVPAPQRPVNELKQVREGMLFRWAALDRSAWLVRLMSVFVGIFALLSGPIAFQTFDPSAQLPEFVLAGTLGSLLVTTVVTLRIYLGWAYVGERLLSATIDYEETGWYDGLTFVKPPEVLARDRLLGTYEVSPVMKRLRTTMLSAGGSLLLVTVLLTSAVQAGTDADGIYGRGAAVAKPSQVLRDGIIYSKSVRDMAALLEDDEAAASEQAAMKGVPGYCGDRYYKAFAGAERVCEKFIRGTGGKQ